MMNIILLLAAVILSTIQATAELKTIYFKDISGATISTDEIFKEQLNNQIIDIDRWALADIKAVVIVRGAHSDLSADYGYIINSPRQLVVSNDYENTNDKSIFDLLTTFDHEYGHLIFAKIISQVIPEKAELYAIGNRISDLTVEEIETNDPQNKKIIVQKIELIKQKELLEDEKLLDLENIVSPYSELFADIVAVYNANSPSAIYNSLDYPNMNPGARQLLMARNFNNKIDPLKWRQREEHVMLGPVRGFLGQKNCWPKNEAQKAENLKFFAKKIAEVISQKLDQTVRASIKYESTTDDVVATNLELIELFKAKCQ